MSPFIKKKLNPKWSSKGNNYQTLTMDGYRMGHFCDGKIHFPRGMGPEMEEMGQFQQYIVIYLYLDVNKYI